MTYEGGLVTVTVTVRVGRDLRAQDRRDLGVCAWKTYDPSMARRRDLSMARRRDLSYRKFVDSIA